MQVRPREVVIATRRALRARVGEATCAASCGRPIRRVVANPADIARYLVEFYNLARSVKKAAQTRGDQQHRPVELRAAGRARARAIGSSMPTTSTSSTSSTGCGSTPSSSAPATSTSSRAATSGSCASASTACCIRCTRCRCRCMMAMTSRIKILGRMDVTEKRRPQDGRVKTRDAGRAGDRAAPVRPCRRPSARSW